MTMSEAAISYSCGSCGYPLNLSYSNRMTSSCNDKSTKKGFISFDSVDLSRFTQVDNINCFPVLHWGRNRLKTKLLCRKCGVLLGYGYGDLPMLCGVNSSTSRSSNYRKFSMKIRALQPLQES